VTKQSEDRMLLSALARPSGDFLTRTCGATQWVDNKKKIPLQVCNAKRKKKSKGN
jgi:hypothetical protein